MSLLLDFSSFAIISIDYHLFPSTTKRRSDGAILSSGSSTNGQVIAPGYASGYVDFYIDSASGNGSYRVGIYQGIPVPGTPGIIAPAVNALVPNNFNVQIQPGVSNNLGTQKWHVQIDDDPNFDSPAYDNLYAWSTSTIINVSLPNSGKYWIRARQSDPNGNVSAFTTPIYFYAGANICAKVIEIPMSECDALAALYNSTNGPNWTNKTGWMQTATPCSWYGVTCIAGHVSRLALSANHLSGSIPSKLNDLTQLTRIWLYTNQLSGYIPSELGGLSNLVTLDLSGNNLTGSIPPTLGNLTHLTGLYLQSNQLTGSIPTELGNLTQLLELRLNTNQLSGNIPSQLGNLSQLTRLWLYTNQLTGYIPPELGGLTNLVTLDLSGNHLSGLIPPTLGNLTNLTGLYLQGNQLSGFIPTELGNLTQLTHLYLNSNQLTGHIPIQFGSLVNITTLYLSSNQFAGEIPAAILNLTHLTNLSLSCGLNSSNLTVINFINTLMPGWQNNLCLPVTTLMSIGAQDGWTLESGETSNMGGSINATNTTLKVGDDAAKRQYRSILSFGSGAALPDNVIITSVVLKVKQQAVIGAGNPILIFQGFMADIKNGYFGTTALLANDFQSTPSKSYGPLSTKLLGNWYSIDLTLGKAYINKLAKNSGLTQIRLRFKLDDNNNAVANSLSLYSGNAPIASRPQLVITYYVP